MELCYPNLTEYIINLHEISVKKKSMTAWGRCEKKENNLQSQGEAEMSVK